MVGSSSSTTTINYFCIHILYSDWKMVGMGVSRRALLANKSRKKRRSSFAHWCLFASLLVLCCWCSCSFFCYNFQQFPEESVIEPSTTRRTVYYLTSILEVLRRVTLGFHGPLYGHISELKSTMREGGGGSRYGHKPFIS